MFHDYSNNPALFDSSGVHVYGDFSVTPARMAKDTACAEQRHRLMNWQWCNEGTGGCNGESMVNSG